MIYYQHIGEKLWARDAPKSIGTNLSGLKRFDWNYIEPDLSHLEPFEQLTIRSKIAELAPTGFQIWGIPSGAGRVLSKMDTGDFLMLLESTDFAYVGQVIHRISQPCWELSYRIWGEQRFPLIVLLQGELISYGWEDFKEHFGLSPRFGMRGNTMLLKEERVVGSPSGSEEAFISTISTTKGIRPWDQERDFQAFANNLQLHFRLVKERGQQQVFRSRVLERQGGSCVVCVNRRRKVGHDRRPKLVHASG